MVLSKKRARKVIEEIIALYPDVPPSLDFTNPFELVVAVRSEERRVGKECRG